MTKKSFFDERSVKEIKLLHLYDLKRQRDLVQRIEDLNPMEDALVIRTRVIPGKFFRRVYTGSEASRKCYKHGNLIALPQPNNLEETLISFEIPLYLRAYALSQLRERKQQEIDYIGYSWNPVFGRDRTKRVVPFVNLVEGARIFTYAENFSKYKRFNEYKRRTEEKLGINVQAYPDAKRVETEGAQVVVEVPSRTKKTSKYRIGFLHVPYKADKPESEKNYNLAIALSIQPAHFNINLAEDFLEPLRGKTPHQDYDIRYKFKDSREQSPVIKFYPHEIAGYMGIIINEMRNENITPMTHNPFALPSKHQAEFYTKLNNNVLIYDSTLSSKDKLRKLHLAEKSILLARAIGHFGHDDFCYWDSTRDGKFRDYIWQPTSKTKPP